jgi:hypothetical protein
MRRLAVGLLIVVAAAGCGGGSTKHDAVPENAYLTGVHVEGTSVRFEFKSKPQEVSAGWQPASRVAECGSGARVRLRGRAFVVVHFRPAASAEIKGEEVVPTYTGPKRLHGPGPVLDAARMCDFEADLGWAIGLERRIPLHVERDGSTVTISFG